jgi:HD superfamily phosphohydrolase YqeK
MTRVAELMESWAQSLDLAESDTARWRAAGLLHDVLRDAEPASLRASAPPEFAQISGPLLHGPVAAERLREEGVADEELLLAVAYHTIGHPEMKLLGLSLFAADFLEPGRADENGSRRALREKMPHDRDSVFLEVAAARLVSTVEKGRTLRAESVGLWNRILAEGTGRGAGNPSKEENDQARVAAPKTSPAGPAPEARS